MLVLQFLIFAMPVTLAAVLHMIAIKLNLLSFLKIPMDFGYTFNKKRIFGDNKTFRGLVLMIVFSILSVYFLEFLALKYQNINELIILDFNSYSSVFYGIMFGLGYILFELPNSFAKRQMNVKEGKRGTIFNILIDQIDSPLGCLILIAPFSSMTKEFFALSLFLALLLHLSVNLLLYLLKLRQNPL